MTCKELLDFKKEQLKIFYKDDKTLYDYYRDIIKDADSIISIPNEVLKKLVKEYDISIVGGDNDYNGLYVGEKRIIPTQFHLMLLEIVSDPNFLITANIDGKDFTFNKILVVGRCSGIKFEDEHTLYIADWGCMDTTSINIFIPNITSLFTSIKFDAIHRKIYKIDIRK